MPTDIQLSENQDTPGEVLAKLAQTSNNEMVLSHVARHRNTPVKTLVKLTRNKFNVVVMDAAANRKLPVKTIRRLSWSFNRLIILGLCFNPSTPVDVLQRFSKQKIRGVARAIAVNENADIKILNRLAKQKDENQDVHVFIASHQNTDLALLEKLAESSSQIARRAVADRLDCPIHILKFLTYDVSKVVVISVAQNPNTPIEQLVYLMKDRDIHIQDAAEQTFLELPDEKIAEFFQKIIDPVPARSWLLKLIQNGVILDEITNDPLF